MATNTGTALQKKGSFYKHHTIEKLLFNQKPINFNRKFMLYQQFKSKQKPKLHESLINFFHRNMLRANVRKKHFPYHEWWWNIQRYTHKKNRIPPSTPPTNLHQRKKKINQRNFKCQHILFKYTYIKEHVLLLLSL